MAFVFREMNEILEEELRCHICSAFPKVGKFHWYKCLNSHNVCYHCKEKKEFKKCACFAMISDKHCKLISELLKAKSMRFYCENRNFGCREFLSGQAMICHEVECLYKQVKCPRFACDTRVAIHELLEHMKDNNEYVLPVKPDLDYCRISYSKYKNGGFSLLPVKFEFDGKIFFLIGCEKDGIFYHWLQIIGSVTEAKHYIYTLEYFGNDASKSNMTFTGQVLPVCKTGDWIIEKNLCFGINYGFFQSRFFSRDCTFKYSVKIRKSEDMSNIDKLRKLKL